MPRAAAGPSRARHRLARFSAQLLCAAPVAAGEEDDPYRVPVVVGVARLTKGPAQGFPRGKEPATPIDFATEAVRAAATDSGAGEELLKRVEQVGMPQLFHDPTQSTNPPWVLQQNLGNPFQASQHWYGGAGSSGQHYINDFARQIAAGTLKGAAILAHGEATHSAKAFSSEQVAEFRKNAPKPPRPARSLRVVEMPQINPGEEVQRGQEHFHGLTIPNWNYAIYENAIRAKNGESIAEHRRTMGQVFSDFSKVAAADPAHAWFPEARSSADVAEPTAQNRMIAGPFFTVRCCAFNNVDMAAAAIITSAGVARELGIPEEKWVYLHGVASTQCAELQCSRATFFESTQHRVGFREAFKHAELRNGPGDVSFFEIYSPFPCMPQLVAPALNLQLGDSRGWTITGGHASHGAPVCGYGATQVAAMVGKLRENRGKFGVVNGCGGNPMTTQSFGVYSTATPGRGWHDRCVPPAVYNAEIASEARPAFDCMPTGDCYIETYVVAHGSGQAAPAKEDRGPNLATVVGRLVSNGHRFVANTPGSYNVKGQHVAEPGMLKKLSEEEGWIGNRLCTVMQDEMGRNIISEK